MINEEIFNHMKNNMTTTSQIFWGHLPENCDFDSGAINFFRLPSTIEQDSGTTLASYQFSVRHTDIYEAYKIKEELIDTWLRWYGDLGDKKVTVFFDTEDGELWEDEDRLVHLPVTINFKYIR